MSRDRSLDTPEWASEPIAENIRQELPVIVEMATNSGRPLEAPAPGLLRSNE